MPGAPAEQVLSLVGARGCPIPSLDVPRAAGLPTPRAFAAEGARGPSGLAGLGRRAPDQRRLRHPPRQPGLRLPVHRRRAARAWHRRGRELGRASVGRPRPAALGNPRATTAGDHHLTREDLPPLTSATPPRTTHPDRIRDTHPLRNRGLTPLPDESTEVGAAPLCPEVRRT
jgi:hypothetical protein